MQPTKHEVTRKTLFDDIKDLRGAREELRLQAKLFKAELKDAHDALEVRWNAVEEKMKLIEASEAVDELGGAIQTMVDELRDQYGRFKRQVDAAKRSKS